MKRFWEIDSLRGIAIVAMVISNFVTDLLFFDLYKPGLLAGFWNLFAYATATTFILLVGISMTLSYSRTKNGAWMKYIKRGLMIFSLGVLITLVTYMFMGPGYILFGVLHLIGLSVILSVPFLKLRNLNLWIGSALIFLGILMKTFTVDFPWLLWLGFIPKGFASVDYFPILPWFGVVLIGIYLGNMFYPKGKRLFKLNERKDSIIKLLSYLGRNSLLIYLIHQPILIGLLYLFWI
ncbi:MAG: DUF1624 domain-containing protein [Candidatus Aenigmarchaeota archaeon]|nr:DUF1624 domain-containing protein [Candidatus Aenigmarchaeota archaeon]